MAADIIFKQLFITLPTNREAIEAMQRVAGITLEPYDEACRDRQSFFWFAETGSRNTVNHDGSVAKSWCLLGSGSGLMNRAINLAHDVEGGMIQPNGRVVLAETFIKGVRAKLKEAVPLAHLHVPRITWTLPARLLNEAVAEPTDEREGRIYRAVAYSGANHAYTKHLATTGRIVLRDRGWPYPAGDQAVYFTAGSSGDDSFLADYLWLSLFETYYGDPIMGLALGQHLNSTLEDWHSRQLAQVAA